MSRLEITTLTQRVLCAVAVTACLRAAPARAQVQVVFEPPAAFIGTTEPVYYEGHAAYWYGNRWYYRDGRAWRSYGSEPDDLREQRAHHGAYRHFYGRGHQGGDRRR